MNRFAIIISVTGLIGIGLIIIGQEISSPILDLAGLIIFAGTGILIGFEAIKKRIFVEQSRYNRRETETYIGIAAILQGALVILLGLFVSFIAVIVYFDIGAPIFSHFIHRPGLPLIIFGIYCLAVAVTAIIGYVEQKQGPRWNVLLELIASRLFPGIILIIIGFIAVLLGVIEIINPEYFDKMGGGFLEILFKTD